MLKPSCASEWSIAQVLSHLGSGAEIFTRFLVAGSTSAGPPEREAFRAIWDDWSAKSPHRQVSDSLAANANFLDRVAELSPGQSEDFRVQMFRGEVDLAGFLLVRLGSTRSTPGMSGWRSTPRRPSPRTPPSLSYRA